MARTRAALGNGARLTDFLSTSLLARVYPSSLIGDLLDAHKCNSQRQRRFPATAVVYYCMALSLYPEAAYGDVFDAVAQGLAKGQAGGQGSAGVQVLHSCFFCAFVHAFFQNPTHSRIVNIKCVRNLLHAVAARSVGLHDGRVARWHGCKPGQRRR